MAEGKQGFVERFLEPHPFWSALIVVLIFVVVCVSGAFYLGQPKIFSGIFPDRVNEWGDFLAGIFAPAALFFLALSVRIQSRELRAAVEAQKDMKNEMEAQVSQMKFAGMAPLSRGDLDDILKKFTSAERAAVGKWGEFIIINDENWLETHYENFLEKIMSEVRKIDENCDSGAINQNIWQKFEDHFNDQKTVVHIKSAILKIHDYEVCYNFLEKLYMNADKSSVSALESSYLGDFYRKMKIIMRDIEKFKYFDVKDRESVIYTDFVVPAFKKYNLEPRHISF